MAHQLLTLIEKAIAKDRKDEFVTSKGVVQESVSSAPSETTAQEDKDWSEAVESSATGSSAGVLELPKVQLTEAATGRKIDVDLNRGKVRFLRYILTKKTETRPERYMEFDLSTLFNLFTDWLSKVDADRFCANLSQGITFEFIPLNGGIPALTQKIAESAARNRLAQDYPHFFQQCAINATACWTIRKCEIKPTMS